MKKKILFFVLTAAASLSLYARTPEVGNVDPLIESNFKHDFGGSVNVSWNVIENISIATFVENGEKKQVYYYTNGDVMAFGRFIRLGQLPAVVEQSIVQRFAPTNVFTVYELKTTSSPTRYLVRLVNQKHVLLVSADEFGAIDILERKRK